LRKNLYCVTNSKSTLFAKIGRHYAVLWRGGTYPPSRVLRNRLDCVKMRKNLDFCVICDITQIHYAEYAIICVICVKHEYLRKNGQVRTASGPLQLRRDRYSCVTGSEATGPPRPFTRPTRQRAGRYGRDAAVTSPGVVGSTMPGLRAPRPLA